MHIKALEGRILKGINQANRDFSLIGQGDRVLVALSGGKDSYGMLWGLMKLQASAVFKFDLVCYHLDQGQPGHDTAPIEGHIKSVGLPYEIEYQDTYTRVVEKTEAGKIYCSLCSRFRRAILYKAAIRHGCNKVALGHHRDDLIETLMLNILYSGQLKSMPARLRSDAGVHEVIRPLAYVPEELMVELAQVHAFPIVPCRLCGSQEAQRTFVKKLLTQLSETSPHIKGNILSALGNVRPSHLLDPKINPLFNGDLDADLALEGEMQGPKPEQLTEIGPSTPPRPSSACTAPVPQSQHASMA
ncbi:hypothetical protein Q3G72_007530 [Acer saccharum]|nr:hypothetical protein Q3G72_007530 [Acer saccharum]